MKRNQSDLKGFTPTPDGAHSKIYSPKATGTPLVWGFTLTEILVAISTFLIIVIVIYSTQLLSQKAYQRGEMATEILQNGRVILEKISRDFRQAKYIVTSLPEIPDDPELPPPAEILFQDGHTLAITESDYAQGGGNNTITLSSLSSAENDYYKEAFIKIVEGTGLGQIRKITGYDDLTKVATVDVNWDTLPLAGISKYRIDSSYYYIKYWKDADNYLRKQIIGYCFFGQTGTVTLRPAAPGDSTQWTPNIGTNWQAVDEETPDDDTTYVGSTPSGAPRLDLYNITDYTAGETINNIAVYFVAKDFGGSGLQVQVRVFIKGGGITTYGPYQTLTSTSVYTTYSHSWSINPRTGTAWTDLDLDDLQIGVQDNSRMTGQARVTQVYLVVNYSTVLADCDNFIFSPWNTKNPEGQTLYELDSKIILKDETIGEFLTDLNFWGSEIITISATLEKGEEEIELRTKIFGRNL